MGRRALLSAAGLAVCALVIAACGGSSNSSGSSGSAAAKKLTVVLAWYPTPEYGGLYAALHEGYFKSAGLDVTVKPGGPQVSATQVVGSGQADIGFLNDDMTLMQARQNGIDLTEFATTYEVYPEALEFHASNPISSFPQANGKTVSAVTGSTDYQWLQHKYGLKNKVVPYSYATFAHDPNSLLLGYAPDDVATLAGQGIPIKYLLVSSSGLDPYADILFAKSDYVKANEPTIRKFLDAFARGWAYYRNHTHQINLDIYAADNTTPMKTNDAISKIQDSFIFGGDAATAGIGTVTTARVQNTYNKLRTLGLITKSMNINDIVNATLMPKVLPPAKQASGT